MEHTIIAQYVILMQKKLLTIFNSNAINWEIYSGNTK